MAATKGAHRKPAAKRRTKYLRVRLTPDVHERFEAAAEAAGINLSAWVTDRLLRVAKDETEKG
jgi:predicted HicB family RNase H-like nuclease